MGIAAVACFTATLAPTLAVTMTSGLSRTDVRRERKQFHRIFGIELDIAGLSGCRSAHCGRPPQPASCSPCVKAARRCCPSTSSAARFISAPMRLIRSGCCCSRRNRPYRRAAEQRDELAPPHLEHGGSLRPEPRSQLTAFSSCRGTGVTVFERLRRRRSGGTKCSSAPSTCLLELNDHRWLCCNDRQASMVG